MMYELSHPFPVHCDDGRLLPAVLGQGQHGCRVSPRYWHRVPDNCGGVGSINEIYVLLIN